MPIVKSPGGHEFDAAEAAVPVYLENGWVLVEPSEDPAPEKAPELDKGALKGSLGAAPEKN